MKAIMIHGAYGNPEENWFPWLKKELEKINFEVYIPKFPTPKNQTLDNWLEIFKNYEKYLDENTILIGYSLGPALILHSLERLNKKVKVCFFISPFISELNNPDFDNINKTFYKKDFNWKKIKENCEKFIIFHSDNDPYVPIEKAEKIAKNLNIEIILIKNAGHFNEKAGFKEFPRLLNKIKEILKN